MPETSVGLTEYDTKPTPDPTVLTTEALQREVEAVKDLINITGDRFHTEIVQARDAHEESVRQRFIAVEREFELTERYRVEQKKDTKDAVDAALAAAKEAVREQTLASEKSILKSETATSEQLRQLTVTFTTAIAGVNDKFDDLKDRVNRIEGLKQGGKEAYAAIYAFAGFIVALIIIGGTFGALQALSGSK